MISNRRLLTLGAMCAGVLWMTTAPASALTVSVGGSNPSVPLPLPLPTSVTATVGGSAPLQVGVQAPGSTNVSVDAGRSGLQAQASAANTPLVDVSVAAPSVPGIPSPIGGSDPVGAIPAPAVPTLGTPAPSALPADPTPGGGPSSKGHDSLTAPGARLGAASAAAQRGVSSVGHVTGDRASEVTASIASSPRAGFLSALPTIGARLLLWLALAGAVIALRLFVGSSRRATRAS
jgi:hypothetical protein